MWLFIFLLDAVICGVVTAIVAGNKGRSGFGWFFVGALLGPIGIVLSLVVSKNNAAIEEKSVRSGGMRKCPYCAELVKEEASLCKHCGRELPSVKMLIKATLDGNIISAKDLINENISNINETDDNGRTPLDIAVSKDDKQMIDFLISCGGKHSSELHA